MQDSKYKYLNDRPVENDSIGHYEIIAQNLYETIQCNLKKPFVVGLFGSWGTGKSSIIEMFKKHCNSEKTENIKVITVDAWRKDKAIFNRQFLKKIARELLSNKKYEAVREKVDQRSSTSNSSWKPSRIAWILFIIVTLIFVGLIGLAIYFWNQSNQPQTPTPFPYASVITPIVGIMIACYFQLLLPRFSVKTDTKCEDLSIHDIDYFREIYFDDIIGNTKEDCICIVIDNLDRVEAGDAIAVIKILKTFIVDAKEDKGTSDSIVLRKLNKVVFILPCCDETLKRHFESLNNGNGYENNSRNGAQFLEKLFNVSFRIPAFHGRDAFQYAAGLIKEMELGFPQEQISTLCHIVSEVYGKNPRSAKVFLNKFLLCYNIAAACENAGKIAAGQITSRPDWLGVCIASQDNPKINEQTYLSPL